MTKISWQQAALALTVILTSFGTVTYTDLFGVLLNLRGVEYNYTGDITCGSECDVSINTTTSYWHFDFANYSGTKYENETLFKKRSRSRTLHINLGNVDKIITTQKLLPNGSWIPYDIDVDWMVPTYGHNWRPVKDGDSWERKKVNRIQLNFHKNPEDTIRWSFGIGDNNSYVDIDPILFASVKWHDNCQTKEENDKFNTIIGKTYWVNDSDSKCKKIEEAQSLKNSPIKCVVDFDGKHKAECLDFNLTHRKVRFDASDLKMKDRAQMVIKIMKPNSTDNGTKMVEKAKMIRSFVVDPIQDMWLEAGFGDEVHFGENSTTITIDDTSTGILADVFLVDSSNSIGVQIKFNITSIPDSVTIDSANMYIYLISKHAALDNDMRIWRITDQTWTESSNAATFNGQSKTNQTDTTYSDTASTWSNINVTDMVDTDYGLDNSYSSLRFEDIDVLLSTLVSVSDDNNLIIGAIGYGAVFEDRENSGSSGKTLYLNVTYSEGAPADTTKPTYSNDGHNTTTAGDNVLFYIQYNDNTALETDGQYIFSTNNTGTWTNESAVNFTATPNWANVSKTLNSTAGLTISYRWYADDNAGNINDTGIFTLTTTDTDPPEVDAYYQWNSTNDTVDFGVWTEGFVSVNWNLTDVSGINTSTCWIRVRNKNYVTNYTNLSYIDDLDHPDYNVTTGYKNLTCYTEDLGGEVIRVSANMTRSYDWRPLITAFEQDNAAHDNAYYSRGEKSTKIVFHNITSTVNTTFIFLADVVNQTDTIADLLFYSCNETYVDGDFTTDDNCALVGAAHPNATRDINFDYLIGALTTDENGMFGGVVHTETMYGISYCPSCTNNGNAWVTYSTDGYDGHSETSANKGTTWTTLSNKEFNVILQIMDNTRIEFNLTIDDNLGNQLDDLRTDNYGILPNLVPYGDIMTDNVTGSLVSYYDIHNITEFGTIWINTTVSDPNDDTVNCTVYLLNNDSSVNQTLLANYSIDGYGICPYEWDTTTISDGDYRLNVTAFDGSLTGYDESAGYIRIANDPEINLSYGPPDTTVFRFATCGPSLENVSAIPQNQTSTYGIDYVCNSGIGNAGDVQVKLSEALASGWTWYASNDSAFANQFVLTTSYQTIYSSLNAGLCTYIWHKANCSYVTGNPGAYEMYQIV